MSTETIPRSSPLDALVVGAGPTGLAAAAHLRGHGLSPWVVEEGLVAQTIRNFPRGVRLFSARENLTLPGLPFPGEPTSSPTREDYLAYLEAAPRRAGLEVATNTRAVTIRPREGSHGVVLANGDGKRYELTARNVIVASGGYFFPNVLGIPGEDLPYVHHYFRAELVDQLGRYVVVGGRNSAIEAAVHIAEAGAGVVIVYHKARLPRSKIKPWLLPRFDRQRRAGRIVVRYRSSPSKIGDGYVHLRGRSAEDETEYGDAVFLLTGYGPDYRLLKEAGVRFHRQTGRPLFDPKTLETKTPGIFVCGTVALKIRGEQQTIENGRDHAAAMLPRITHRVGARRRA